MKKITQYFSPCVNLLKAMLGCGVASFPILFQTYGIIPCITLLLVSALLACLSLSLFLIMNKSINKKSTLSTLALDIYPPFRYISDFLVCTKCFFVTLAYFILIEKQISIILTRNNINFPVWPFLLVFTIFGIITSTIGKFEKLKFISFMGVFSLFVIILISTCLLLKKSSGSLELYKPNIEIFNKFGVFIFGFGCHQAILSIQNEHPGKTLNFFIIVVFITTAIALSLFVLMGCINSLLYNMDNGNGWPDVIGDDYIGYFIRLLFSLVIVFSIPIQITAFTSYFIEMFNIKFKSVFARGITSTVSLMLIFFISLLHINFMSVINNIGSTISSTLYLGLPSLYYILFLKKYNQKSYLKLFAYFLFLVYLLVLGKFIFDFIRK